MYILLCGDAGATLRAISYILDSMGSGSSEYEGRKEGSLLKAIHMGATCCETAVFAVYAVFHGAGYGGVRVVVYIQLQGLSGLPSSK